jgi:hypothetical protein
VPVVLVPAVPLPEGWVAGGLAAEGQAGSPAGVVSPAGSATRAVSPSRMASPAKPGHRELPATTSPIRLRRVGPGGHVSSRLAAPTNPVAGPAQRGRPRRR